MWWRARAARGNTCTRYRTRPASLILVSYSGTKSTPTPLPITPTGHPSSYIPTAMTTPVSASSAASPLTAMAVSTLVRCLQEKETGIEQDYLDALNVAAEKLLEENYTTDSLRQTITTAVFEKDVSEPVLATTTFAQLAASIARSHPHLMRSQEDLKQSISRHKLHYVHKHTPCHLYFRMPEERACLLAPIELCMRRQQPPKDAVTTPATITTPATADTRQHDYVEALNLAARTLTARVIREKDLPYCPAMILGDVSFEELARHVARSHPHLPRDPSSLAEGMVAFRAHHIANDTLYYTYFQLRQSCTIAEPGKVVDLVLHRRPAH